MKAYGKFIILCRAQVNYSYVDVHGRTTKCASPTNLNETEYSIRYGLGIVTDNYALYSLMRGSPKSSLLCNAGYNTLPLF